MRRLLATASIIMISALVIAAGAQAGTAKRIHGTVEQLKETSFSIGGHFSMLTVKADDGKTVTADVTDVDAITRKALTRGQGVTVVGQQTGQHMVARSVRLDASSLKSVGKKSGGKVMQPSAFSRERDAGVKTTPRGSASAGIGDGTGRAGCTGAEDELRCFPQAQ